ncbi:adenylate/guanylate cyclase domain-containing protein [Algiphilus aromaticivorans]|uniref:adenylate/guanylate cyclase domain-containing protein n=1 Tax=Algiphilus aromaticivorans TaxID=382454 RepID=UPI000693F657|nr:adenylate/guanylate cyclase domain-containing protein [Algiphilus aromaticivorans]
MIISALVAQPGHGVAALLAAGIGLIFLRADVRGGASRALSLCLIAIAAALVLIVLSLERSGSAAWWLMLLRQIVEVIAILAGIEWGRRIGATTPSRLTSVAGWLFRAAQLLAVVYGGLLVGYLLIAPEQAVTRPSGLVEVRGLEFAIFAPVLGSAILLAAIAILLLRLSPIDRAELLRIRALFWAAPWLLAALVATRAAVPYLLTVGLLIFLLGAVRYLMLQSERGLAMSQFVAPKIAGMVRKRGLQPVMRRERREITAIMCDLRGFTAFAARSEPDVVVDLLEAFYQRAGAIAATYDATVKDHAGDGLLILVGAPDAVAQPGAVAARIALKLMTSFRTEADEDALPGLGIGIASGAATVGAVRGAGRLEYVAIGDPVNLAARLCGHAADGEVLCDDATRAQLDDAPDIATVSATPVQLKGFEEAVTPYRLQGQ